MVVLSFICAAVLAPPQAGPQAKLTSTLDSFGPAHFNGIVYLERDGKPLYFHAVGYADRTKKLPFSSKTGIEMGSIVKPVAKVALLKLVEAGKLRLGDPISKFFPAVPPDKRAITVAMLSDHSSGFQDVFGGDYEPMTRDHLVQKMLASKLLFAPGTDNKYSNAGYSMLAAIIEMVTGSPFERVVAKTVFAPIGLRQTGYVLPHWKSQNVAHGYSADGSSWGTPLDRFWYPDGPSWNLRGNGGMITTIPELAKWVRLLHSGGLLSPAMYKEFAPILAAGKFAPNQTWAVAGGNGIFDTVAAYNPSRRLVVIAFSSDARFEIESVLRKQLAELIYQTADAPANRH